MFSLAVFHCATGGSTCALGLLGKVDLLTSKQEEVDNEWMCEWMITTSELETCVGQAIGLGVTFLPCQSCLYCDLWQQQGLLLLIPATDWRPNPTHFCWFDLSSSSAADCETVRSAACHHLQPAPSIQLHHLSSTLRFSLFISSSRLHL